MPVVMEFLRLKFLELWGAVRWLGEMLWVISRIGMIIVGAILVIWGVVALFGAGIFTLSYITGVGYVYLSRVWATTCPLINVDISSCFLIGMLGIASVIIVMCWSYLLYWFCWGVKAMFSRICLFFSHNWAQAKRNVALRTSAQVEAASKV